MKEQISLIHPDEVEEFFLEIGWIDDLNAGKLQCHSCGTTLTLENFRGVFREKEQLFFVCRKEECLEKPVSHSDA